MPLISLTTSDCRSWRDIGGTGLRIYRLTILWWTWIWGRRVKSAIPPQVHDQARETVYMNEHPEIWPPEDSANGEADHGSTGG